MYPLKYKLKWWFSIVTQQFLPEGLDWASPNPQMSWFVTITMPTKTQEGTIPTGGECLDSWTWFHQPLSHGWGMEWCLWHVSYLIKLLTNLESFKKIISIWYWHVGEDHSQGLWLLNWPFKMVNHIYISYWSMLTGFLRFLEFWQYIKLIVL